MMMTYIWAMLGQNAGNYSTHGSCGAKHVHLVFLLIPCDLYWNTAQERQQ